MSQIILALIAIVLASGAGVLVMANVQGQSKLMQLSEDRIRLDEIARALEGSIERVPGTEHFAVPAAKIDTASGWAELPDSVGMANETYGDIPYLYCPIGRLSSGEAVGLGALGSQQIETPGGLYNASTYNGLVVSTDLALDGAVESQLRPLAILVAASVKADRPPNCGDVRLVEGVPVVAGGLVRVVSEPAGGATADAVHYGRDVEFWVSDQGTGNGNSYADAMHVDMALDYYVKFQPDSFTLNFGDYSHASDAAWQRFIQATANSGGSVTFRGFSPNAALRGINSGFWATPGKLTIENMTLYGPAIGVEAGDEANLSGFVNVSPYNSGDTIRVYAGGRLNVSNASVGFLSSLVGIRVEGETDAQSSEFYAGEAGFRAHFQIKGGSVKFRNSQINRKGEAASIMPILVDDFGQVASDAASSVGAKPGVGCWQSRNGDLTFAFSNQTNSRVPPESNYAPPTNMGDQAAVEAWQIERAKRIRARRQNMSQMACV